MTDISATIDGPAQSGPAVPEHRGLQRIATIASLVAIGLAVTNVRLASVGDPRFALAFDLATVGFLGTIVLFPLVGALIVQRRPTTRVAWLMIGMGLALGIGLAMFGYAAVGMPPRPPLPGALAALVLSQLFFVPAVATGSTYLFLLFPTDRFIDARWRLVGLLSVAGSVAFLVGTMLGPSVDTDTFPDAPNPVALPATLAGLADAVLVMGNIAILSAGGLGAASLMLRYGRGDRIERAQIRWVATVGALAAATFAVSAFQIDGISEVAWGLGFACLATMPIAIGIAITRYRLFEIDRLINRALVYGSLTAILAGVFTAAIGLAQRLFVATTGESSDAAIVLTTLVVATLYAPLRKRLEAIVDRRFKYEELQFGAYRDELTKVLSVLQPIRAAERLVTECVRELDATGGAVVDSGGTPIATAGEWPVPPVVRIALPGIGPFGALLVGPRKDGRLHDPRSVAQLEDTARLVATAVRLTGSLDRPS